MTEATLIHNGNCARLGKLLSFVRAAVVARSRRPPAAGIFRIVNAVFRDAGAGCFSRAPLS